MTYHDYTGKAGRCQGWQQFLPKQPSPPVIEAAPAPAAQALDFSRIRLLLVEDNAINMEIARMILTDAGFMVDTAEDGRSAVEIIAASRPGFYDCILMDIQMPIMNGYEATMAIRAMDDPGKKNIPIVAMTANVFQEDVQAARNAGMNGHIAKPLDVPVMMETLTRVLKEAVSGYLLAFSWIRGYRLEVAG